LYYQGEEILVLVVNNESDFYPKKNVVEPTAEQKIMASGTRAFDKETAHIHEPLT
jgi:hypothetical protein